MPRPTRKNKRKSRRQQRKSRRQQRSHRSQHGGGACAAQQYNHAAFNQMGGMAPLSAGDSYLLDGPTRIQAQVGSYDAAFAELPSVIPKQHGGRRGSKRQRRQRRQKSQRRQRSQRGGMAPFSAPGMLLDASTYRSDGTNPQFHTEGAVNPEYHQFKGPQYS
jgi:hypothetical protein